MQTRAISLIIIVLFFLFTHAFTVTLAATHATTIRIDKPIHFVAPNGDNVVIPAGVYTIEVTEEWLRLTPGKARDALLLQAQRSTHEEMVEEPVALSIPSDQDLHHIMVLLPDGESLVTIKNTPNPGQAHQSAYQSTQIVWQTAGGNTGLHKNEGRLDNGRQEHRPTREPEKFRKCQ